MLCTARGLEQRRHMPAKGANGDRPEKLPPGQRERKLMHATKKYAFRLLSLLAKFILSVPVRIVMRGLRIYTGRVQP